jgi:hypothetical protein
MHWSLRMALVVMGCAILGLALTGCRRRPAETPPAVEEPTAEKAAETTGNDADDKPTEDQPAGDQPAATKADATIATGSSNTANGKPADGVAGKPDDEAANADGSKTDDRPPNDRMPLPPPADKAAQWRRVEFKEAGHFYFQLPDNPVVQKPRTDDPSKSAVVTLATKTAEYKVIYQALAHRVNEEDAQHLLSASCEKVLAASRGGKLLVQKDGIQAAGPPPKVKREVKEGFHWKEIVVRLPHSGIYLRHRVYYTGQGCYIMQVQTAIENAAGKDFDRFFESLVLPTSHQEIDSPYSPFHRPKPPTKR